MIVVMPILSAYIMLAQHFQWGTNPLPLNVALIMIAVFLLVMLIFYNLTIYIEGNTIHAKFGIGIFHFKFPVDQLHETTIIRTSWWNGWGIRFTTQGMLYNVYGRDAVKIRFTSKGKTKTILLGTAEPEELKKYVNKLK